MTRTVKAAEFKAKCLDLMDQVASTGDRLIVTKRGRPVVEIGPVVRKPQTLRGFYKGRIKILGDIVSPIDEQWDAEASGC